MIPDFNRDSFSVGTLKKVYSKASASLSAESEATG